MTYYIFVYPNAIINIYLIYIEQENIVLYVSKFNVPAGSSGGLQHLTPLYFH